MPVNEFAPRQTVAGGRARLPARRVRPARELRVGVLRWPGGNFVSSYH